jgi:hypothetical protein
LDADADENFLMWEAFLVAVEDGSRCEEAAPAFDNFID